MNGRTLVAGLWIVYLMFCTLNPTSGWGLTLEEARSRLQQYRDEPQYGQVFQDTLEQTESIHISAQLLLEFEQTIPEEDIRLDVLLDVANVAELAGYTGEAHELFKRVLTINPDNDEALIGSASTALEMGNTGQTQEYSRRAITAVSTLEQQKQAARIRARALALDGARDSALLHARSLASGTTKATVSPKDLYLLYRIAVFADRPDIAEEAATRLSQLYPDSPEHNILSAGSASSVHTFPSPSEILLSAATPRAGANTPTSLAPQTDEVQPAPAATRPETVSSRKIGEDTNVVVGIQTGSFRDPENAEYMTDDLEELGFTAEIQPVGKGGDSEDRIFYRVVVPVNDSSVGDAQQLVVRLKENGIEGFLLFRDTLDTDPQE